MLDAGVDAEQLAFELDALGAAANQHLELMHDEAIFDRAATAIRSRLDAAMAV